MILVAMTDIVICIYLYRLNFLSQVQSVQINSHLVISSSVRYFICCTNNFYNERLSRSERTLIIISKQRKDKFEHQTK